MTQINPSAAIQGGGAAAAVSSQGSLPIERILRGRGNKIVVGTAVKAKIGELEEEVRVGNTRRMSGAAAAERRRRSGGGG